MTGVVVEHVDVVPPAEQVAQVREQAADLRETARRERGTNR